MKKIVMKWLRDVTMGVGASMIAAGLLGAMTPGTRTEVIAVCVGLGAMYMVTALLASYLVEANP